MTTPIIPTFTQGVGKLATDRYDFENHILGTSLRHKASGIDLDTPIIINSSLTLTVEDAIIELSDIINPVLNQATTTSLGVIKLSGDLSGGIATNLIVTGIQGRPITTTIPVNGDVLTWSSGNNAWLPEVPASFFVANGDLAGSSVVQQVIGLTGSGGTVNVSASNIIFTSTTSPVITQLTSITGPGANLSITAQSSSYTSANAGNVSINGGTSFSGGLKGGVSICLDNGAIKGIQFAEIVSGRKILSLLNSSAVTTTNMPAGTGDMVMYIGNTLTPPTSGSPVNGTVLYSYGGQLYIKQSNGDSFAIGSIPNPSIWGSTGQQSYTYQKFCVSPPSTSVLVLSYALQDNTATKIDVILVGKALGASDSACFNLSMGYSRYSGGAPVAIGTVTNADPRVTSGAATGWTIPAIFLSGNNMVIYTGTSLSETINWMTTTQIITSLGV